MKILWMITLSALFMAAGCDLSSPPRQKTSEANKVEQSTQGLENEAATQEVEAATDEAQVDDEAQAAENIEQQDPQKIVLDNNVVLDTNSIQLPNRVIDIKNIGVLRPQFELRKDIQLQPINPQGM